MQGRPFRGVRLFCGIRFNQIVAMLVQISDRRRAEITTAALPLKGVHRGLRETSAGTGSERTGRSPREWGVVLLVFWLSCLYLLPFYRYTVLNANEGIILQGAQRILTGQMPYRDFFSFFTPGSYYWMALLFKLFGNSIVTARIALVIYGGALSALTYLLARRVCSRWSALLATLPGLLICLPNQFFVMHNWDSTLWALLALYCAVRWLETLTRRNGESRRPSSWALATGLFTATTCLFEQSKGAGLALGLAAGFLIVSLSNRGGLRIDRKSLAALSLGFVLPVTATIGYFAARHALPQMATDLLWPFRHYAPADKLPYGWIEVDWPSMFGGSWVQRGLSGLLVSPWFIICALPIFALPILVHSAFQIFTRPEAIRTRSYYVIVSAALCGLLLATLATGRPDVIHIMYQVPAFALVLAWAAEAAKTRFLRAARTMGVFYVLVSFGALAMAILLAALNGKYKIETRRGVLRAAAPYTAFEYIQRRTAPGERILVYPYQPTYYYLTGTSSVSRYEYLQLGMHTPHQFQQMAEDVKTARPRVVLFDPSFTAFVPAMSPEVSPSILAARDPVADYVFAHYHPCRVFAAAQEGWHMVFMLRDDFACSEAAVGKK